MEYNSQTQAAAAGNLPELKRLAQIESMGSHCARQSRQAYYNVMHAVLGGELEIAKWVIDREVEAGRGEFLFIADESILHFKRDTIQLVSPNANRIAVVEHIFSRCTSPPKPVGDKKRHMTKKGNMQINQRTIEDLLLVAVEIDDVDLISHLLSMGFGSDELFQAILIELQCSKQAMQQFLDHGFDCRFNESNRVIVKYIPTAEALIEAYLDDIGDFARLLVFPSFSHNMTLLMYAARFRLTDLACRIVRLMKVWKINISTQYSSDLGVGPLHVFALSEPTVGTFVCEAVKCGFDLEARSNEGLTPFALAIRRGKVGAAIILLQCGANIDCAPKTQMMSRYDPDSDNPIPEQEFEIGSERVNSLGNLVHLAIQSRVPLMLEFVRQLPDVPSSKKWVVSPNYNTPYICSPLELAVRNYISDPTERADQIVQILKDFDSINMNVKNFWTGKTILHLACATGNFPVIMFLRLLIDMRVDLNARDFEGRTPLHDAAELADESAANNILRFMLAVNRNPKIKQFEGFEMYLDHSSNFLEGIVKEGIDSYRELFTSAMPPDPQFQVLTDVRDHSGRTPLHLCRSCFATCQLLLPRVQSVTLNIDGTTSVTWTKGCNPDILSTFGGTALHGAAVKVYSVDPFLDLVWPDIDAKCRSSGTTPMMKILQSSWYLDATGSQAYHALMELLRRGAGVNHRNHLGKAALHFAARSVSGIGTPQDVFDLGADPSSPDGRGRTPLHYVSQVGNTSLMLKLLDEGADPNAADESGWTSLHSAATNCHDDCVEILLNRHANPNSRTNCGRTPLHCLARSTKCVSAMLAAERAPFCLVVAHELLSNGADPQARDNKGFNALHEAGLSGNALLVSYLLGEVLSDGSEVHMNPIRLCDPFPMSHDVEQALRDEATNASALMVVNVADMMMATRTPLGCKRPREPSDCSDPRDE